MQFAAGKSQAPCGHHIALRAIVCFANADKQCLSLHLAPDGRRLSKRDGDLDLDTLLGRFTPEQIVGALAFAAGLLDRKEAVSAKELAAIFDWNKVRKEDICLSIQP